MVVFSSFRRAVTTQRRIKASGKGLQIPLDLRPSVPRRLHSACRWKGWGYWEGVFCGFWPGPLPAEEGNDRYLPPPLIEARNSALLLFLPILSSISSIASTVDKGLRTFL